MIKNFYHYLIISFIFLSSTAWSGEFSPLWSVISSGQITGVTKEGNGICTKDIGTNFGANTPSPKELVEALTPNSKGCIGLSDLPDSDLNAYECDAKNPDCSSEFIGRVNKEFGCEAELQKTIPQQSEGKKLGNIIVFKTKNCRIRLLNHKIPCSGGFASRYLDPDQKGFKICFKQSGDGGTARVTSAPKTAR